MVRYDVGACEPMPCLRWVGGCCRWYDKHGNKRFPSVGFLACLHRATSDGVAPPTDIGLRSATVLSISDAIYHEMTPFDSLIQDVFGVLACAWHVWCSRHGFVGPCHVSSCRVPEPTKCRRRVRSDIFLLKSKLFMPVSERQL